MRRLFLGLLQYLRAQVFAQPYPSKPITLVVGFPPGGGTDILGSLCTFAEDAGDSWVINGTKNWITNGNSAAVQGKPWPLASCARRPRRNGAAGRSRNGWNMRW